MQETLAAVLLKQPELGRLPLSTPPALFHLIERCLERDPLKRLRDIGEARIVLEAPMEPRSQPTARPGVAKRAIYPWVAAALFASSTIAVSIFHFRESPPEERPLRFSISAGDKAQVHSFAISPDGRSLALAATTDGKRQLLLKPLDSFGQQLLANTMDADMPFWSPDNRYIGFFADGKLKKFALNGGLVQTVCDASMARGGTWSREGMIVFSMGVTRGLRRVAEAGGVPTPFTGSENDNQVQMFPNFLPDGIHLLFVGRGAGPTSKWSLNLASPGFTEIRRIAEDTGNLGLYAPPSAGKALGHILFLRRRTLVAQPFDFKSLRTSGELFPIAEEIGGDLLFTMSVSVSNNGVLVYRAGQGETGQLTWMDRTGKTLGLVGAPATINGFSISPDGKRVAISRGSALECEIWLHELDRNTETRFTTIPPNTMPSWSPDGRRVLYSGIREGPFQIFQKEANGSGQEEVFSKPRLAKRPSNGLRTRGMYCTTSEALRTSYGFFLIQTASLSRSAKANSMTPWPGSRLTDAGSPTALTTPDVTKFTCSHSLTARVDGKSPQQGEANPDGGPMGTRSFTSPADSSWPPQLRRVLHSKPLRPRLCSRRTSTIPASAVPLTTNTTLARTENGFWLT